jgi:hypothetical protein
MVLSPLLVKKLLTMHAKIVCHCERSEAISPEQNPSGAAEQV